MKKNTMMRVASALLVAVLLSTCAISGTFAKYVTTASGSDTARVAKWGVDFTAQSDLFETSYTKDDNNYTSMDLSVKSSDTKNVVAPGTSGTGYSFATTGTPEVSYRVSFATTANTTPETVFLGADGADRYYPVVFTLKFNNAAVTIQSRDIASVLGAVANCAYYFDVATGKYYATTDGGTNWSDALDAAPSLELSWNWDFYVDAATDVKDTALGNLAAGKTVAGYTQDGTDYNLDIAFDISATATQID